MLGYTQYENFDSKSCLRFWLRRQIIRWLNTEQMPTLSHHKICRGRRWWWRCCCWTDSMISTLNLGVNYFEWQWKQYGAIWCAVLIAKHPHMTGAPDFNFWISGEYFLLVFVLCHSYSHRLRFNHLCFAFSAKTATATVAEATAAWSQKLNHQEKTALFFPIIIMTASLLFLPFFTPFFFCEYQNGVGKERV